MSEMLINSQDLEFQLYDLLQVEQLNQYPRFQEHNKETFNQAIDTARKIAEDLFAPHNQKADHNEPLFDGKTVTLIPEVQKACDAFIEAGFMASKKDFEVGGMQLPITVNQACFAYFQAANISTAAYPFLTIAAANLLDSFGDEKLKSIFLPPMLDGRFFGTMCLTEPHAGSSLSDITTKAQPQADGSYNISGNKIFISAGDHQLSENIIHFVLAKIEGAPAGVKGISLFLVPKLRVDEQGQLGQANDVNLAGLFHKMGYRGTVSSALNFGEKNNCQGFLIGEEHKGLAYMFQMMNEARIGVGMGATMITYAGYLASLDYAKGRPQGRKLNNKNPTSPQINIIEHTDVKRLLISQKAIAEGAFSLCLYAAYLMDLIEVLDDGEEKANYQALIDLLTPIVKSWPSEFGERSLSNAVQIHGGSGYTREYIVEQLYRDNRLNPIHEGTTGIQAMDLLGRKILQNSGLGLKVLLREVNSTLEQAAELNRIVAPITKAKQALEEATTGFLTKLATTDPDKAMANATAYLTCFGTFVIAWTWLKQADKANQLLKSLDLNDEKIAFYKGKIHTAEYFVNCQLPLIYAELELFKAEDLSCYNMQADWF